MGRFIIKIKDYYLEWSSIVDAPVTYGMTLEEYKEYYQFEYGRQGMDRLDDRLKRVEEKGTSSHLDKDAKDTISCNRAGPNESALTLDEVYKAYCLRNPVRGYELTDDGWIVTW